MSSDADKEKITAQLGIVYAGIPTDCWAKVCIISQRMDEQAFVRDILYRRGNDGLDEYRQRKTGKSNPVPAKSVM